MASQDSRSRLVEAVRTPLGFFTLAILVLEAAALAVIASIGEPMRPSLLALCLVLIFLTVLIVAFLVFRRPELFVFRSPTTDEHESSVVLPGIGLPDSGIGHNVDADQWADLLGSAKEHVDILDYSLQAILSHAGAKGKLRAIFELAKEKRFRLRIVLADPKCPMVKHRASAQYREPADLEREIVHSINTLSEIADRRSPVFHGVKTVSGIIINYSLLRVDDKMFITPYLSCIDEARPLTFKMVDAKTELFGTYQSDFEQMWRRGEPIHSRRVVVPPTYVDHCSEKLLTARSIARYWDEAHSGPPVRTINCLDIGCGDGTLSFLTFNRLAEMLSSTQVRLTFLDPSVVATTAVEEKIPIERHLFTVGPTYEMRWQDRFLSERFDQDERFDLILCSHTLGAIYQQCEDEAEFRQQFMGMLSSLTTQGFLCIVQALDSSIESNLRIRRRVAPRETLSSERLRQFLETWGVPYRVEKVEPLLRLEGWLGADALQPGSEEMGLLYFLFAPQEELAGEVAAIYRRGLRANAVHWRDLDEEERASFKDNCGERIYELTKDNDLFVRMHHECIWLQRPPAEE